MSNRDRIAKLEALLGRVRARAGGAPAPVAAAAAAPALSASEGAAEPDIVDVQVGEAVIDLAEPFEEAREPRAVSAPVADEADVMMVDDEAPSSSRRIIGPSFEEEERISEAAFGTVEPRPPLHTPPPESGRLPAAPMPDLPAARPMAAEPVRPSLGKGERAGEITGEMPPLPMPRTFLELLDASLSL
jgi:hypothetical protein